MPKLILTFQIYVLVILKVQIVINKITLQWNKISSIQLFKGYPCLDWIFFFSKIPHIFLDLSIDKT